MSNRVELRDSAGALLAYKIGPELATGLSAYSSQEDFLQMLSWNYQAGTVLQTHEHLQAPRSVDHTQEAIVVLQGSLRADVFDSQRQPVDRVTVGAGECMVFLQGGHGYEILEDETRVLEIKNGPYPGAEADRERYKP